MAVSLLSVVFILECRLEAWPFLGCGHPVVEGKELWKQQMVASVTLDVALARESPKV